MATDISRKPPTCLNANPHYYDYIHHMNFGEDGTVELWDGGGQCMNFEATGTYKFTFDNDKYGKLTIKLKGRDDIEVKFGIEKGPFFLNNEMIRSWDYSFDYIYMAKERYVFESDPLSMCESSRRGNLMFMFGDEGDINKRTYYEHCKVKTAKKWKEKGIDFTENGYFKYHYEFHSKEDELIKDCDSIDQLIGANKEDNGTIFEYMVKRMDNNNKLRARGSVVAYYNKDIEILGYYVLERLEYWDKETKISFTVLYIHKLEILPDLTNGDTIINDMITTINYTMGRRYGHPAKIIAIILPDEYDEYSTRFEKIGFKRDEAVAKTEGQLGSKTYESKMNLFYKELEMLDFDREMNCVMFNTEKEEDDD